LKANKAGERDCKTTGEFLITFCLPLVESKGNEEQNQFLTTTSQAFAF
jgi:hypothetical protein